MAIAAAVAAGTEAPSASALAPAAGGSCSGSSWVDAWGTSQTRAAPWTADVSVRVLLTSHVAGDGLRIRFSNSFSDAPLPIGRASVAVSASSSGPRLRRGTLRPVRFDGRRGTVIPPGSTLLSDPVDLSVSRFTKIAVSAYLPTTSPISLHDVGMQTSWQTEAGSGDAVDSIGGARYTDSTEATVLVDRLLVHSRPVSTEVVAFGDSITDGFGSGVDHDRRYPDFLQRALTRSGTDAAVINAGVTWNALTLPSGFLPSDPGTERFGRDVLGYRDANNVILAEGVNDLNGGVSAGSVIAALRKLRRRAASNGLRPFVATISPNPNAPSEFQAARQRVNAWIRRIGRGRFVDFDRVVRDRSDPTQFGPGLTVDGTHPSAAGYRLMAAAAAKLDYKARSCGD